LGTKITQIQGTDALLLATSDGTNGNQFSTTDGTVWVDRGFTWPASGIYRFSYAPSGEALGTNAGNNTTGNPTTIFQNTGSGNNNITSTVIAQTGQTPKDLTFIWITYAFPDGSSSSNRVYIADVGVGAGPTPALFWSDNGGANWSFSTAIPPGYGRDNFERLTGTAKVGSSRAFTFGGGSVLAAVTLTDDNLSSYTLITPSTPGPGGNGYNMFSGRAGSGVTRFGLISISGQIALSI
jgi:hypothetical protein